MANHRSNRYVLFRTVPSSATTTPTRSLTYAASLVCIQCRQLPAELLTRCSGALRWAVSCCVRQQYAAATTRQTLAPLTRTPQLPTLSLRLFCSPTLYHTKRTLAATESDISRLPVLHLAQHLYSHSHYIFPHTVTQWTRRTGSCHATTS